MNHITCTGFACKVIRNTRRHVEWPSPLISEVLRLAVARAFDKHRAAMILDEA